MENTVSVYMAIIRSMIDSGELSQEQCFALDYAHELMMEDLIAIAQYTQDEADRIKELGMMN